MSARLPTQQKVRYVDTVARDHLLVITASINNLRHYTTNYSKDQYNHGFDKFYFFYFCTGVLQFWLSLAILMTFPQWKKLALRHYRHLDNGNSRQICSYVFGCLPTGACSGFSWCLFFLFVCLCLSEMKEKWWNFSYERPFQIWPMKYTVSSKSFNQLEFNFIGS